MATHHEAPPDARPRLGTAGTVARLALIGIALAGVAGIFAYLGGWLTPNELTPSRLTNGFEEVSGIHSGFRRNHAKGLGISGFFESNGAGTRLSKAIVFRPGRVNVIGRFSLPGGNPDVADTPQSVRGFALEFSLPNGEFWRTAMLNLPIFVPAAAQDKNYLFDALIKEIHRQPLRWHLRLIVGQAGDPTNDATIPWPPGRETVDVGTLTLDGVESEATSPATDINFDPLVLPFGIAPSDDPLLSARSAVYSQSFTRREGETKEPSAVTPEEVRKGG